MSEHVGRISESWDAANAARRKKHPNWHWKRGDLVNFRMYGYGLGQGKVRERTGR